MFNNNIEIIIKCPHCEDDIFIEQLNCGIFRHGVFKNNLEQIPPHSTKEMCEDLFSKNLIFGCGKPFKIDRKQDTYVIEICDYI